MFRPPVPLKNKEGLNLRREPVEELLSAGEQSAGSPGLKPAVAMGFCPGGGPVSGECEIAVSPQGLCQNCERCCGTAV